VEYVIRSGDVADEIVKYAKESNASLIIMGAYGHTRVRDFILGSITSQVLNQMPCPVLLQN
jgi:nucleotide-binding universal stress UspA family protein